MAKEKTLVEIIRELYHVSGFRISIYNSKREEVCAWPVELQLFCQMVQVNPECLRQCRANDDSAFIKAGQTGEVVIYRCHMGLYEAVAPLYDRGRLSGYLMMGQTLDTMKHSRQEVLRQAVRYIGDNGKLHQAVEQIPDRTKAQIFSCVSIMEVCASYISLSNRFKASEEELPHKVRAYIEENYQQDITLDGLCQMFYCSRATLTNSFRKTCGSSVHQYLMVIRLQAGCELLTDEGCTVGQAARMAGFQDQNYFTKAFKKEFGITPSNYRKTISDRRSDESAVFFENN